MIILLVLFVLTEFIEGVSQFSVKGDKLSKLRCKYSRTSLHPMTNAFSPIGCADGDCFQYLKRE